MNERQKKVVSKMITLYCRSKHSSQNELCEECQLLREYAVLRLETCPFGEDKPTCGACPIHCYKKNMREKIKKVMRFAAPRMLFLYPIETIRHGFREIKGNRNYAVKIKSKRD